MSSGNFSQLLTKSIIVCLEEDKSHDILIIRLYALTHPVSIFIFISFFQTQSNTYCSGENRLLFLRAISKPCVGNTITVQSEPNE